MTIKKILITVDQDGLKEKTKEFECKKTKTGYVINRESGFGGKTTRIKFSDILKPYSPLRENLFYVVSFSTWYFDNEENARKIILDKVKTVVNEQLRTAQILMTHIS